MDRVDKSYDRPREKVRRKGVSALGDAELLQLIIGSGTGKNTVGMIAKKAGQLLRRYGSNVSYDQLSAINGMGPARTSQLLAMFELASRYPVDDRRTSLKSNESKHLQFLKQKLSENELGYITMDGAARLIRHRKISFAISGLDVVLRTICADAVADKATHLQIGRHTDERLLIPTLTDLSAAKNSASVGKLLGFTAGYIVYNEKDWHSVTKDVSHVER